MEKIRYLYSNPRIIGESCPICGCKGWNIFRCDCCGSVFCEHCEPECVKKDIETESIEVTCPECGTEALFVEI